MKIYTNFGTKVCKFVWKSVQIFSMKIYTSFGIKIYTVKWGDFEQFLLVFATILKMVGKWGGDKKYVKIAYQRSWAILPNAVFSETVSKILYCIAEINVPFKVNSRFGVTLNGSFNLTFNDKLIKK